MSKTPSPWYYDPDLGQWHRGSTIQHEAAKNGLTLDEFVESMGFEVSERKE